MKDRAVQEGAREELGQHGGAGEACEVHDDLQRGHLPGAVQYLPEVAGGVRHHIAADEDRRRRSEDGRCAHGTEGEAHHGVPAGSERRGGRRRVSSLANGQHTKQRTSVCVLCLTDDLPSSGSGSSSSGSELFLGLHRGGGAGTLRARSAVGSSPSLTSSGMTRISTMQSRGSCTTPLSGTGQHEARDHGQQDAPDVEMEGNDL